MINFRYHVVSLAAVLLALAAGVVLGAGYLDRQNPSNSALGPARDEALAAFNAGYAERTSPRLLQEGLADRTVVLFTTPGARVADVRGVRAAIESAKGEVVGRVDLSAKLLDPAGRQFADEVISRATSNAEEVSSAPAGFERVGTGLARAYLTADNGDVDEVAQQLDSALAEAGLSSGGAELESRADLAVVVTSDRDDDQAEQQGATLAALAAAMDAGSDGVVVAGPTSSSQTGGILAAVRSSEDAGAISTVDVADQPAGRTVVALAAIRELDKQSGSWGTSRSPGGSLPE